MSVQYAYPKLSRLDLHWFRVLGPGLGNLLFPWARSEIAAESSGLYRLRPTWPQLKVGPWLRREPDKRGYSNLFADDPMSISGVRRLRVLAMRQHVSEDEWATGLRPRSSVVVVFSGLGTYFEPLIGYEQLLHRRLLALERHSADGQRYGEVDAIAMHVRLGDFRRTEPGAPSIGNNQRTPFEWYRDAIKRARADVGDRPVIVYSDGSNDELHALFTVPGVRRARQGNALQDMLAMASSAALIASVSTFSGWSSFLGQMPTYWPQKVAIPGLDRPGIDVALPVHAIGGIV